MVEDDTEIEFSLANSASIEIIECSRNLDLGTKAEEPFAQTVCGGYLGRVGTREIARNLGEEIKAKIDKAGPLVEEASTQLLLVPHHFSVRTKADNFLRTLSSVGIIVDFVPGDENFGIVDLLPNPAFKAAFGVHASGEIGVSFSTLSNIFLPSGVGVLVDLALDDKEDSEPRFGFSMNFGHSFFASEISTTGVGTTTSVFEFFSGSQPLVGKDLTAWSAVAFNEHGSELTCKIKLFYTSRLGVIPKRCESRWTECKVRTR